MHKTRYVCGPYDGQIEDNTLFYAEHDTKELSVYPNKTVIYRCVGHETKDGITINIMKHHADTSSNINDALRI